MGNNTIRVAGFLSRCGVLLHAVACACVVVMQAALSHPLAEKYVPAAQWQQHLSRWQTLLVLPWCIVATGCGVVRGVGWLLCCECRQAPKRVAEPELEPELDAPPIVAAAKQRGGTHLKRRKYPRV